jgi:ATP-binding cassette subfamily C protein/ATP-binding cassette subfamily C protein EexD
MTLNRRTDALARDAEVIDGMGMVPAVLRRWQTDVARISSDQQRATDRAGMLLAAIKAERVLIQVACLGLGAWLALQNEITGGAMVAASILLGRALAPIEQLVGTWRQLVSARQAFRRVSQHLARPPLRPKGLAIPDPEGHLAAEQVTYGFDGSRVPLIKGINFALEAGQSMALLGPSAAGKTTLVRLLIGALQPSVGVVRLDGANIFQWPREDLGRYIGYLPQDVQLFEGSVFANIARFEDAEPRDVIAAARLAGAHDMILRLPKGYETEIGEGGAPLSGGQRQLVGLARALYGNPRLAVLDEPNANMDTEGEIALLRALDSLKARGTTVIMVTHRPSLIQSLDKALVLRNGAIEFLGPRDEVLKRLVRPIARPQVATGNPIVSRIDRRPDSVT